MNIREIQGIFIPDSTLLFFFFFKSVYHFWAPSKSEGVFLFSYQHQLQQSWGAYLAWATSPCRC